MIMMLLLLSITAMLLFGAHSWKRNLRVASIVVLGTQVLTVADVTAQARVTTGEKLFAVDLNTVKHNVEMNPFVQQATVQRDVPDRITILVEERQPIAAIMVDHLLYLDPEGYVLPPVRSDRLFDLPVISGSVPTGECVPGKRIQSPSVLEALALLTTARLVSDEMYHRISEVHVEDQRDMVVYTVEYGIPVIVGKGNAAEKLINLDGFWKNIVGRQGAQGVQYVDLRFEDQVVVRWDRSRSGGEE
jgi:cell division protein FtsQ